MKPCKLTVLFLTLFAACLVPGHCSRAQDAPAQLDQTDPEGIRQQQPAFYVRAEVNHSTRQYREGDYLDVQVASEEDAFLYVLYKQADGSVVSIFPNVEQPNNLVKAGQAVQIPAKDDQFRWKIGPPYGQEVVKVIASKQPIKALNNPKLWQARFNPVSREEVKGVAMELDDDLPQQWSESDITIETHPVEWTPEGRPKRRVGVFFGVSNYHFHSEAEAAGGHLNLGVCHEDAKQLAALLREVGQLSEYRVYTNEEATKSNLEQAVTEWLPEISRPGDTVMIFFSGHGGQMADDNQDEADERDEFLLPYDFIDLSVIAGMKKLDDQGRLDPAYRTILETGIELVNKLGAEANEKLSRATGVSDDLFGHWLQALDGRQVVVVLDVCHAGGFAAGDKGQGKTPAAPRFDFLDRELSRLKDIGQDESCVLAACAASNTSQVRQESDLSVLTYSLLESIRNNAGTLTIEQAHRHCETAMQAYFEQHNRQRLTAGQPPLSPHHPQLSNFCRDPVLLKP